jgi:hypothetical protein
MVADEVLRWMWMMTNQKEFNAAPLLFGKQGIVGAREKLPKPFGTDSEGFSRVSMVVRREIAKAT